MPREKKRKNEFAGFVANPQALRRGGAVIQTARGRQQRGLLERLAQAELQRFWRVEIAVKSGR